MRTAQHPILGGQCGRRGGGGVKIGTLERKNREAFDMNGVTQAQRVPDFQALPVCDVLPDGPIAARQFALGVSSESEIWGR